MSTYETDRLIVCAHDAGGAEILSSWLQPSWEKSQNRPYLALAGPAIEIFQRKLGPIDIGYLIPGADLVVCGSSKEATLEKNMIKLARANDVRTVIWLDHWKNYRQRISLMPDEIWVTDAYAAELAEREFPDVTVKITGNPWLDEIARTVRPAQRPGTDRLEHVLYAMEPGRQKEMQRWMHGPGARRTRMIRYRPHPSVSTPEHTLAEDLSWADTVVGAESMALVAAVKCGRKAVSTLSEDEELVLPYPEIERAFQPAS
jgi:hypothetical protein